MYEWEVDFQEVWVQGSLLDDLDLKVGRQIVNWGRSDSLRVLDVLNPLDNREPGLVDIEDLRRPVTMVKVDYYLGDWALSAIAIPEIRFNLNPPFGSDFAPVLSSLGTVEAFVFPEEIPDESFANTEWAVALKGIFSGWDVSFHYARYWRDLQYLSPRIAVIASTRLGPVRRSPSTGTELRHSRLDARRRRRATTPSAAGCSRAEIAWIDGIDYTTSTPVDLADLGFGHRATFPPAPSRRAASTSWAASSTTASPTPTSRSRSSNRHIFGFRRRHAARSSALQENLLETALRITRTFMNERLEVTALGIVFGSYAQDGSVVRLDARYDLRDALELGGGIVFYQKGDPPPFDTIKDNDRIFFEIKYSF